MFELYKIKNILLSQAQFENMMKNKLFKQFLKIQYFVANIHNKIIMHNLTNKKFKKIKKY